MSASYDERFSQPRDSCSDDTYPYLETDAPMNAARFAVLTESGYLETFFLFSGLALIIFVSGVFLGFLATALMFGTLAVIFFGTTKYLTWCFEEHLKSMRPPKKYQ